jgi:hypothetical protein
MQDNATSSHDYATTDYQTDPLSAGASGNRFSLFGQKADGLDLLLLDLMIRKGVNVQRTSQEAMALHLVWMPVLDFSDDRSRIIFECRGPSVTILALARFALARGFTGQTGYVRNDAGRRLHLPDGAELSSWGFNASNQYGSMDRSSPSGPMA